jgi:rhodanese-related sulfurtransferase
MKNDLLSSLSTNSNNSAELLGYIESKGDYFNSINCPSLITAPGLNSILSNVIMIDIRDSLKFNTGYIQGAVNIKPSGLISYLKQNNISTDKQIVVISTNGQSASYCTAGLRLVGYQNAFALKYGMASWNKDFADEWLSAIKERLRLNFVNGVESTKPSLKNLPSVNYTNTNLSIQDKLLNRVTTVLSENFADDIDVEIIKNTDNNIFYLSDGNVDSTWDNYFKICYGNDSLFYSFGGNHLKGIYHYRTAPIYDLRSDAFLQSLPANSPVLIYTTDGHLSAEFTMYLKVLGYDAKSLLFGGNFLVYSYLNNHNAFSYLSINNYPYEANSGSSSVKSNLFLKRKNGNSK